MENTGRLLDSPVKKTSGKNLDAHTFLVTLSPKGNIDPACVELVLKWVRKNSLHAYVVIETGSTGQRHVHMSLAFSAARSKTRLQEDLWKFKVKPYHSDSIGKYAVVVTNQYNHHWYETYLKKEEAVEVLHDTYDLDAITSFFPTEEQQLDYQTLKGKKPSDQVIHSHEVAWTETSHPVTVAGALYYLRERMFQLKDMQVIQDERRVRQLALALYRYRSGNCDPSQEDDEWLARSDPVRGALYTHDTFGGSTGDSKRMWKDKDFSQK